MWEVESLGGAETGESDSAGAAGWRRKVLHTVDKDHNYTQAAVSPWKPTLIGLPWCRTEWINQRQLTLLGDLHTAKLKQAAPHRLVLIYRLLTIIIIYIIWLLSNIHTYQLPELAFWSMTGLDWKRKSVDYGQRIWPATWSKCCLVIM